MQMGKFKHAGRLFESAKGENLKCAGYLVENAKGENEDVEVLRQVFPFGIIEQIDKHLSGDFEFVAYPPYR